MSEKQVKIAAKLYECRDSVKRLVGPAYREMMADLAAQIVDKAKRDRCYNLAAATRLAERCGGLGAVMFLAAYVEMTEPSVAPDAAKGAGRG
jgi:hypothetical protein